MLILGKKALFCIGLFLREVHLDVLFRIILDTWVDVDVLVTNAIGIAEREDASLCICTTNEDVEVISQLIVTEYLSNFDVEHFATQFLQAVCESRIKVLPCVWKTCTILI